MTKKEENEAKICFSLEKDAIAKLEEVSENLGAPASKILSQAILSSKALEFFKEVTRDTSKIHEKPKNTIGLYLNRVEKSTDMP